MTYPMIVAVPDLHNEDKAAGAWDRMASWIVANKTTLNIIAVAGLGDNVSIASAANFSQVKSGWDTIDTAGIPYVIGVGNHDYDDFGDWVSRPLTYWDAAIPLSHFTAKSWYGGAYAAMSDNMYIKVVSGKQKYLIFSLEFIPRAAVMNWVLGIVRSYPDYEVIISTHAHLNSDASIDPNLASYGSTLRQSLNWSNTALILNGHSQLLVTDPTTAIRNEVGGYGKVIPSLYADYQQLSLENRNDSLMLITLQPEINSIDVKSYSPYLETYDPTGAYTLPLHIARNKGSIKR